MHAEDGSADLALNPASALSPSLLCLSKSLSLTGLSITRGDIMVPMP